MTAGRNDNSGERSQGRSSDSPHTGTDEPQREKGRQSIPAAGSDEEALQSWRDGHRFALAGGEENMGDVRRSYSLALASQEDFEELQSL
jgi:hypothetical protein